MRRLLASSCIAIATLSSAGALAQEGEEPHVEAPQRWHAALGAGTDFPLAIDVRGQVEAPYRLRLSSSVGVTPGAYVGAINGIVLATGAYDRATADLVSSSFDGSFVWRTHVGWRPFPSKGFYFEAGYGRVSFHGDAPSDAVYSVATGQPAPSLAARGGLEGFHVASTLHMLDVELGWDLLTADRLLLRASIGAAFTMTSSTRITTTAPAATVAMVSPYATSAAAALDRDFTSYGFTPVVGVSGSYFLF